MCVCTYTHTHTRARAHAHCIYIQIFSTTNWSTSAFVDELFTYFRLYFFFFFVSVLCWLVIILFFARIFFSSISFLIVCCTSTSFMVCMIAAVVLNRRDRKKKGNKNMYTQVSYGLQTVSECFSKRLLENQDKYPCVVCMYWLQLVYSLAGVAIAHTQTRKHTRIHASSRYRIVFLVRSIMKTNTIKCDVLRMQPNSLLHLATLLLTSATNPSTNTLLSSDYYSSLLLSLLLVLLWPRAAAVVVAIIFRYLFFDILHVYLFIRFVDNFHD